MTKVQHLEIKLKTVELFEAFREIDNEDLHKGSIY